MAKETKGRKSTAQARNGGGSADTRFKPGHKFGKGRPALNTPEKRLQSHVTKLATRDLREEIREGMALAQTFAPGVLTALAEIAMDVKGDTRDRITAGKELLLRAYGPAEMAPVAFAGMNQAPQQLITVNQLSLPREAALQVLDRALALLPSPTDLKPAE